MRVSLTSSLVLIGIIAVSGCLAGNGGPSPFPPYKPDERLLGNPDSPYTTSQIALVDERTIEGWTIEFYRNYAYTCTKEGYHTFVIAYRDRVPLREPHPLWIRLHGGGVGAFLPAGTYQPRAFFPQMVDEEGMAGLASLLEEQGLVAKVKASDKGFRFLMPSMCDHDLYSGVGSVDPHNPFNPDENGNPRRTDGLLAVRAALDFAQHRMETTHAFAHGTSAGSVGAMTLSISLGREGKKLSGAILDSGALDQNILEIAKTGCQPRYNLELATVIREKIGPYISTAALLPSQAIASGIVRTPLFDVWSWDDPTACGSQVITITDPLTNQQVTGPAIEMFHGSLDRAIDTYNPGGTSAWRQLCVDDPDKSQSLCDYHSPTTVDAGSVGGDRDRSGEDYNQIIMEWVEERLQDAPPPL